MLNSRSSRALRNGLAQSLFAAAIGGPVLALGGGGDDHSGDGDPNRLPDTYLPLQLEGFPSRPKPIFELGNPFLGPGELQDPITLPTGAIWSPSLVVWGNMRTGVAAISRARGDASDWANRLDLFAEARLSPTERFVIGLRPLDDDGEFTGYNFEEGDETNGFNLDVQRLFFEGDFGEIFPGLDREETRALDIGFGIGRQPLNFQDGILINDTVDAITVTRNSLRFWGASNFRATALLAWNDIERGNNVEDQSATVIGLLTATDFVDNYVEIDLVATVADEDQGGSGVYAGVGSTQRIGAMNSTFRVNASMALDDSTAAVDDGVLLTSILSWVPHHTHDNLYVGSFIGIENFTSAARGPVAGGPLANIGILFAAIGLGNVGAPISNAAREVFGGAVGYQQFFDHGRSQMVYEVGARVGTDSTVTDSIAAGARYRRAIGQHAFLTLDVFAGAEDFGGVGDDGGFVGGRAAMQLKF